MRKSSSAFEGCEMGVVDGVGSGSGCAVTGRVGAAPASSSGVGVCLRIFGPAASLRATNGRNGGISEPTRVGIARPVRSSRGAGSSVTRGTWPVCQIGTEVSPSARRRRCRVDDPPAGFVWVK